MPDQPPAVTALVLGAVVGAAAVLLAWLVLRRLPEPTDDRARPGDPTGGKPTYDSLIRPSVLTTVGLLAAATTAVAVLRLEPLRWPGWFALALVATVLAVIDALTTWLPNAVMYPFWLVMGAALVTVLVGGGTTVALTMAVGGLAWAAVFWVVWRVSRGQIGFGDVRLALGLGAAAGAAGWTTIYTCLLAGTVIGALWGVVHRWRHGRGPFAYGMALYLGCGVGLALTPR